MPEFYAAECIYIYVYMYVMLFQFGSGLIYPIHVQSI